MLVGVSGFGSTGSGAVMDFLREFDEVGTSNNLELSFLYDPNGVIELEERLVLNPMRFNSSDAGIKSFLKMITSYDLERYVRKYMSLEDFRKITNDYIEDLVILRSDGGLWHYDRRQVGRIEYFFKYIIGHKYLRLFDKMNKEQPQKFLNHCIYYTVHDERFYVATKKYTSRLISKVANTDKKIIALDQPFPSNSPERCFQFFDMQCKAIVVNRDPRDVYLISKRNARGWEMRFTPTKSVDEFIIYYKDQMNIKKAYSNDVLYVQFEDLIYEYEGVTTKIKRFLELKEHKSPKKYFDPDISNVNTQMFLRYPEYMEDIKKIEKELPEYIYNFDATKAKLDAKPWVFSPGDK